MAYLNVLYLSQRDIHRGDVDTQDSNSDERGFSHDSSDDNGDDDEGGHQRPSFNPGSNSGNGPGNSSGNSNGQSNKGDDNNGDSSHSSKTTTSDPSPTSSSQTTPTPFSTLSPSPSLSLSTITTTVSQTDSNSVQAAQSSTSVPAVPNGSPFTLITTTPSSATASSSAIGGLNNSGSGPNVHLATILIPVIVGMTFAIAAISFLYVRMRRKAIASQPPASLLERKSSPNGGPETRSWNSVTWPGFERILNRTSAFSRGSSRSGANTIDLERARGSNLQPCRNPKVMSSSSLFPKKSIESDERDDRDDSKRVRSSMFSIITLPPDA